MTAAAAYRPAKRPDRATKNYLAVLSVDGRITDEHGTIYTDKAVKWCCAGPLTVVFAGDVPLLQDAIEHFVELGRRGEARSAKQCLKSWRAAHALKGNQPADSNDALEWSAVAYNSVTDELHTLDSDGTSLREHSHVVAIGSGSEVALGYLLAKNPDGGAWRAADAKLNMRGAIRAAAKRNANVSSRCTVLLVGADGRVSVRG